MTTLALDQNDMSTWIYFYHRYTPKGRLERVPIAATRAELDAAMEQRDLVWCNHCTAAVEPYHRYIAGGLTEYCEMCDERTELWGDEQPKDYPPFDVFRQELEMRAVMIEYKPKTTSRTWRACSMSTTQYTWIFHQNAVLLAHQENWHTFRIVLNKDLEWRKQRNLAATR